MTGRKLNNERMVEDHWGRKGVTVKEQKKLRK